jgi:hypothetical protein
MDWQLAIDRNRTALLTIIVALMKSLGLVEGGGLTTLPHVLYRKALGILRPAESAVRRLIMIAAHEMALRGVKLRARRREGLAEFLYSHRPNPNSEPAIPAFNLIDPLKTFGREAPNTDGFDRFAFAGHSATPDRTPVPAAALGLRLLALKKALDDLPKQATRLARWYHQRDLAHAQRKPHRHSPMRPGSAPGSAKAKRSEVGAVLTECHLLAIYARDRRDSS